MNTEEEEVENVVKPASKTEKNADKSGTLY